MNLLFAGEQDISWLEQRKLAARPDFTFDSLLSGDYTREMADYFADHFVFRDYFVVYGTKLRALRGLPAREEVAIVTNSGDNMGVSQGDAPENANEEDVSAVAGEQEVAYGMQGNYLVVGNRGMSIYYYTRSAAEQYAAAINQFSDKVGRDYRVYCMIVPSAIEYLDNEELRKLSPSQAAAIDYTATLLKNTVTNIAIVDVLRDHADEYIFFRTDHHWTALGAYYAYQAFAKAAGLHPLPLDSYIKAEHDAFLGTIYSATLSEDMKDSPDALTVYKPKNKYSFRVQWRSGMRSAEVFDMSNAGYSVFLGGDSPRGVITTKHPGRKILIIKDSTANAFIPFIISHYSEIHILDLRSFGGDVYEYLKEHRVDDILFINSSNVTSHPGYTRILEKGLALLPATGD